ncbi:MAG: LPS export ABC transporter ATP-binding protein [bacterium]|nr:LPS export ABC transporter ATP-binding protein [bacterium]
MILKTVGLVKRFGQRVVVKNVSIEIKAGEIVGLLGPNGAGKTTTFYMITGLLRPNEGKIYLDEVDITSMPIHKRARLGIGYLPQEPSIFRKLTVEENLWTVLQFLPMSNKERITMVEELLEEFGIAHLRKSLASSLSGGEARRLEVARSLLTSPKIILLDEPFLGIDPITVADIQVIINQLKEKGLGILITDHNVRETLSIVDRAYIINEGEVIASGEPNEIANDSKVKQIYLGEKFVL